MARSKWSKSIEEHVWNESKGKCHHCNKILEREPRSGWHIDHYPVRYADIEDQCLIGVTNPNDVNNLVASCPSCNLSHRYERDCCCGYSQLRLKKIWVKITFLVIFTNSLTYFIFRC